MTILNLLIRIAIVVGKVPVVRLMLYICLGALSKTFETLFIAFLPMDRYTHAVFVALHFFALGAFCVDVINILFEGLFGVPLFQRREQLEGKPMGDEKRSLLKRVDLRKALDKAKSLMQSSRPSPDGDE